MERLEKTQYTTVIHNNIIYKLYIFILHTIIHTYTYKDIYKKESVLQKKMWTFYRALPDSK